MCPTRRLRLLCTTELRVIAMTRSTLTVLLVLTALVGLGCLGDYEVASDYGSASTDSTTEQASGPTADSPPPPPMGDPSSEAPALSQAEQPVAEEPAGPAASPSRPAPPRAVEPTAVDAGPVRSVPSRQPSIRLSTGVALPQSLPTGLRNNSDWSRSLVNMAELRPWGTSF